MATDHDALLVEERLLLRAFCSDDAGPICEAVLESLDDFLPWLPWCHAGYSIDDTRAFLAGRGDAFENDGEYAFAMIERPGDRLVGACGLNQFDRANARANLGYWVRSSATRRGFATQATRMLARWAMPALGLQRIEIVVAQGNRASQRVAGKVGATREGVARNRLLVRGVPHDSVVFSLVPADLAKWQ
ncbi:MAG: GNAT family N-acetyltransferase [Pirellulales bacterium]